MKMEQYQVDLCARYKLLFSFLVIYLFLFVEVNEVDFIVEKWFKEPHELPSWWLQGPGPGLHWRGATLAPCSQQAWSSGGVDPGHCGVVFIWPPPGGMAAITPTIAAQTRGCHLISWNHSCWEKNYKLSFLKVFFFWKKKLKKDYEGN